MACHIHKVKCRNRDRCFAIGSECLYERNSFEEECKLLKNNFRFWNLGLVSDSGKPSSLRGISSDKVSKFSLILKNSWFYSLIILVDLKIIIAYCSVSHPGLLYTKCLVTRTFLVVQYHINWTRCFIYLGTTYPFIH